MTIFLLWFGIFSFTVLAIAVVVALSDWIRFRTASHAVYLGLMGLYCFWLVLYTFLFFSGVVLVSFGRAPLGPGTLLAFGLVRTVVSAAILFLFPHLILLLLPADGNRGRTLKLLAAPVAYCAGVVVLLGTRSPAPSAALTSGISVVFYAYLSGFALAAAFRARGPARRGIPGSQLAFLRFAAAMYPVFLLLSLPSLVNSPNPLIQSFPRAAFCLGWGLIEIVHYVRRGYRAEQRLASAVQAEFVQQYGITEREQEVIRTLAQGATIKTVADSLFISSKTVETHLYNIYRKCGVSNRVALLNLLQRFRLGENP